jgi:hypothetical protein
MIPVSDVDEALYSLVEREGLVFRGQPCLHTDVYLLCPASMTEKARTRFDGIMEIRRTGRTTVGGFFRAAGLVLGIVGLRGIVPFVRVVTSIPNTGSQQAEGMLPEPDRLERSVLALIEQGFGLCLCLLPISEPTLALGFDYAGDLQLLVEYERARGEGPPLSADSGPRRPPSD